MSKTEFRNIFPRKQVDSSFVCAGREITRSIALSALVTRVCAGRIFRLFALLFSCLCTVALVGASDRALV